MGCCCRGNVVDLVTCSTCIAACRWRSRSPAPCCDLIGYLPPLLLGRKLLQLPQDPLLALTCSQTHQWVRAPPPDEQADLQWASRPCGRFQLHLRLTCSAADVPDVSVPLLRQTRPQTLQVLHLRLQRLDLASSLEHRKAQKRQARLHQPSAVSPSPLRLNRSDQREAEGGAQSASDDLQVFPGYLLQQ